MAGAIRTLLSLATVLALAACSSTTPAPTTAPAPPSHAEENAAWIARDFTCTRAEAKTVKFDVLVAHPERFDESCVRVAAFFAAFYYKSQYFLGMYILRDATQKREPEAKGQLAAYMKDPKAELHFKFAPTFATLTGRIRSCAARTERQTAATTPLCRDKSFGLFVSDVQIVPTAMD